MKKIVFGIHIGNTNSSVAACKSNGQIEMIVDESGDRIIPSNATVTDEETIIGFAAKSSMGSKWKTTITNNKRLLNLSNGEVEDLDYQCGLEMTVINNEIYYSLPLGEKTKHISPQRILTVILRKLYDTAKSGLNLIEEKLMCVLLVPRNFTDEACANYKTAAETAGWKVLQMINETAAAVLAYSLLDHKEPSQTVLVYRLGGSSCEVAAYELSDGLLYILQSDFYQNLGGNQFTEILTEYLIGEFYRKYKLDPKENRRSIEKLKLTSEKCVHILSKATTAHCFVESLQDGVDFSLNVSQARFEQLIKPVLPKFTAPIETLLQKLELEDPIDKVILCGSATMVPKLKSCINDLFDLNATQILSQINADEVLALGAAEQGYYLLDNDITEFLSRQYQISADDPPNSDKEVDY